jgi:hypothetical protein
VEEIMAPSDDIPTYETLTIDNVCRDVITISEVSTVLLTDGTKQAFIESWFGVAAEVEGNTDLLVIEAKYGFAVVEIETGEMKYVARVYTSKADAERYVRGPTEEQAFSHYNIGVYERRRYRLQRKALGGYNARV